MISRYKRHGWFGESQRHYLAAKGVKTARKPYFADMKMMPFRKGDRVETPEGVGTLKEIQGLNFKVELYDGQVRWMKFDDLQLIGRKKTFMAAKGEVAEVREEALEKLASRLAARNEPITEYNLKREAERQFEEHQEQREVPGVPVEDVEPYESQFSEEEVREALQEQGMLPKHSKEEMDFKRVQRKKIDVKNEGLPVVERKAVREVKSLTDREQIRRDGEERKNPYSSAFEMPELIVSDEGFKKLSKAQSILQGRAQETRKPSERYKKGYPVLVREKSGRKDEYYPGEASTEYKEDVYLGAALR